MYGHYYNPRNGWTYDILPWDDIAVEIRSSGRPAYYMTIAGAERFTATLERLS